ncbi:hypothetical protein ACFQ07_27655 [Actinomadura adrarensis]|uniref:Lipoprotein n=1 Tax=Actinomadura adrarensis TaxID=1819600 RepID=A0ABW3CQ35_9ACTN
MRKTSSTMLAATVLVAALGLTACGSDRWCEHDATDQRVSDSYCERNTPGYEWEDGDSSTKVKKKKRT